MNEIPYKTYLAENELPVAWYNLRADMKTKPAPLLNPETRKPVTAAELEHVFCKELVRQELDDTTQFIPIPDEVMKFYRMFRPSPLIRAYFLVILEDRTYFKCQWCKRDQIAILCSARNKKTSNKKLQDYSNRQRKGSTPKCLRSP